MIRISMTVVLAVLMVFLLQRYIILTREPYRCDGHGMGEVDLE